MECLPPALFRRVGAAIDRVLIFTPLSVGQLLEHRDLVDRAKGAGAHILVPTGALTWSRRRARGGRRRNPFGDMVARKPPAGLDGAPYLASPSVNPRTRRIVAPSAVAALRGLVSTLKVAT